jgi:hypothetical protein
MKRTALELRYTMSRKRPTDDDIRAGNTKGRLKARLVAKDLKCIHKLPEEHTYCQEKVNFCITTSPAQPVRNETVGWAKCQFGAAINKSCTCTPTY